MSFYLFYLIVSLALALLFIWSFGPKGADFAYYGAKKAGLMLVIILICSPLLPIVTVATLVYLAGFWAFQNCKVWRK